MQDTNYEVIVLFLNQPIQYQEILIVFAYIILFSIPIISRIQIYIVFVLLIMPGQNQYMQKHYECLGENQTPVFHQKTKIVEKLYPGKPMHQNPWVHRFLNQTKQYYPRAPRLVAQYAYFPFVQYQNAYRDT